MPLTHEEIPIQRRQNTVYLIHWGSQQIFGNETLPNFISHIEQPIYRVPYLKKHKCSVKTIF
jgi:hypothetical protein